MATPFSPREEERERERERKGEVITAARDGEPCPITFTFPFGAAIKDTFPSLRSQRIDAIVVVPLLFFSYPPKQKKGISPPSAVAQVSVCQSKFRIGRSFFRTLNSTFSFLWEDEITPSDSLFSWKGLRRRTRRSDLLEGSVGTAVCSESNSLPWLKHKKQMSRNDNDLLWRFDVSASTSPLPPPPPPDPVSLHWTVLTSPCKPLRIVIDDEWSTLIAATDQKDTKQHSVLKNKWIKNCSAPPLGRPWKSPFLRAHAPRRKQKQKTRFDESSFPNWDFLVSRFVFPAPTWFRLKRTG